MRETSTLSLGLETVDCYVRARAVEISDILLSLLRASLYLSPKVLRLRCRYRFFVKT